MATCPARWKMTSGRKRLDDGVDVEAPCDVAMDELDGVPLGGRETAQPCEVRRGSVARKIIKDGDPAGRRCREPIRWAARLLPTNPQPPVINAFIATPISAACGSLKTTQPTQRCQIAKSKLHQLALAFAGLAAAKGDWHLASLAREADGSPP